MILGNETIIHDCSYNDAFDYIEEKMKDNLFGKYISAEAFLNENSDLIEFEFEKAIFSYDCEKCILTRRNKDDKV